MKSQSTLLIAVVVVGLAGIGETSSAQSGAVQPAGQKTLAATLNVYVFPTQGQNLEQQTGDEAACYNWAVENTGSDPFNLQKQAQQQMQQAEREKQQAKQVGAGSGAEGAVRGAAAGALIGAIAGDAGKGAAWGAGVGLVGGAARGAESRQRASAQADRRAQQTQQATAQQMENFKKAFSVCLEAKKYMVKY